MKNKVILVLFIIIFVFINLFSFFVRVAPTTNKINEIVKEFLPNNSKPIIILMEAFFVSNPWIEIIYVNQNKINILKTTTGGQSNSKYGIISEVINSDIFNYLWIVNIILILIIIIFFSIIIKQRKKC